MWFVFDKERLVNIVLHYLGIDISYFTDYQLVVSCLLVGILTLLSCWFTCKICYSVYNKLNH